MTETFDIQSVRKSFPALQQSHQVYFDNAGGTQVLGAVATSIKNYLEETNVQLGATYNVAKQSTESYNKGMEAAARFINAHVDEIVLGPSTTQLFSNLSQILNLPPQSELVLSAIDHEANISPWLRLAKLQNHTVKWWKPSSSSTAGDEELVLTPENLRPLLSEKTRLVTCTHASNVLGTIHDIRAIADEVHKIEGARLCVDGVALAPHREVDVKALGVDFYSFSWYKVYGPHIALLYASLPAQQSLDSLGHYFHTRPCLETKLGLASASYELVSALPPLTAHFGVNPNNPNPWPSIAHHEERLSSILLDYLTSRKDVTIYGLRTADRAKRVPVISFGVEGWRAEDVVGGVEGSSRFGCRWGHFYSKRLVDGVLGVGDGSGGGGEGVVRVSLVHYNSEEEITRFVEVLDRVLKGKKEETSSPSA